MKFLQTLIGADSPSAFAALLPGRIVIDDPRFGHFEAGGLGAYFRAFRGWIGDRPVSLRAVEEVASANRLVEEWELRIGAGADQLVLPWAQLTDRHPRETQIRIYYSSYPIDQTHRVRAPLLEQQTERNLPQPVRIYQEALAEGDLETVVQLFADGAVVREPSGGVHMQVGGEGLREFYGFLFSFGGGCPLQHCTVTDNGRSCAIEYNVVRIGQIELPPQAGIAVYDYRGEQLTGARIYDDFEPPAGW